MMARWGSVLAIVVAASVFSGCRFGKLAFLGLNGHGNMITRYLDDDVYKRKLKETMLGIHSSVLTAMDGRGDQPERDWELQLIAVGVGLRAEAGFGPFKVGVAPGVRAFFTNSDNPPPLP